MRTTTKQSIKIFLLQLTLPTLTIANIPRLPGQEKSQEPKISLKSKIVPPLSYISKIEIDLTEAFGYENFKTLQDIEYSASEGKLEWTYKLSTLPWNYPTFGGNLNLFTLDDYFSCYFSAYNGTHAHISKADSSSTKTRTLNISKEEWESLHINSVWTLDRDDLVVYRIISYIDKFGYLRIEQKDKSYRIPLNNVKGRSDYDIISRDYYADEEKTNIVSDSVFYFKTSTVEGFYSNKFYVVFFQIVWGSLEVRYISLFNSIYRGQIQKILNVDCFFRGKEDVYCIVNLITKNGEYPDNLKIFLLKYKHSKFNSNSFHIIDAFNEEESRIYEGVINLEKNPEPFKLKSSSKLFAYDKHKGILTRCVVSENSFDINKLSSYFQNCTHHKVAYPGTQYQYVRNIAFIDHFYLINIKSKIHSNFIKVGGVISGQLGSPKANYFEGWKEKIGLIKGVGFFTIDLREKLSKAIRGYIKPALLYKLDRPILKKSDMRKKISIKLKYKENEVGYSFHVKFNRYYNAPLINNIRSGNQFNVPNTVQHRKFWYKSFVCNGDYIHFKLKSNYKFNVEISHYYQTYLPNIEFNSLYVDEGGCGIPASTSCCGKICINLNSKKTMIFLEFSLGYANNLVIQKYSDRKNKHNSHFLPVKMDISHLGIKVKRARALNHTGIIFVQSTEYDKGYLLDFDHKSKGFDNIFKLRVLEGINSDHFLSKNGFFSKPHFTHQIFFSYFSYYGKKNQILDYTMVISTVKCFVSLKSKILKPGTNDLDVKIVINSNKIENLKFKVNNFKDDTKFSLGVRKILEVEKYEDLHEFELNFYEYFNVTGHGPAIDFPLSNDFYLNKDLRLKVDEVYSYYKMQFDDKKIPFLLKNLKSSNKNFTFIWICSHFNECFIQIFKNNLFLRNTKKLSLGKKIYNIDVVECGEEVFCFVLKARMSLQTLGYYYLWKEGQKEPKLYHGISKLKLAKFTKRREYQILSVKRFLEMKFLIAKCDFEKKCNFKQKGTTLFISKYLKYEEMIRLSFEGRDYLLIFTLGRSSTYIEKYIFNVSFIDVGGQFEEEMKFLEIEKESYDRAINFLKKNSDFLCCMKSHYEPENRIINLMIDSNDRKLFVLRFKIFFFLKEKKLKFGEISIEEYFKPVVLNHYSLRLTKDFLVCSTIYTPLRRYLEFGTQKAAMMMVWPRRNGAYDGDGYIYRVEKRNEVDTQNSVIVEDYKNNIISALRIDSIKTEKLKKSIIIVKTHDHKIIHRMELKDIVMTFRGNYWSLSDHRLDPELYIKIKNQEDEIKDYKGYAYSYFLSICFVLVFFGLLYTFMSLCFFELNSEVKVNVKKADDLPFRKERFESFDRFESEEF